MITTKIVPAHILRLYAWQVLSDTGAMEKIDDLVPIIPVEDEPKVRDAGKPYAIYGYAENEATQLDQIRRGVFSMRVITPDFTALNNITNTTALAFESTDIATEAVNRFAGQYPNGVLQGIRFTRIKTTYIEGGEAAETEGGPVDGVVNVAYEYINHLNIPVPLGARGGLWTRVNASTGKNL